jgi:hypothetical protein
MIWIGTKHFLEEVLKDISSCFQFGMVRKSCVKTVPSVSIVDDMVDLIWNALLSSLKTNIFKLPVTASTLEKADLGKENFTVWCTSGLSQNPTGAPRLFHIHCMQGRVNRRSDPYFRHHHTHVNKLYREF